MKIVKTISFQIKESFRRIKVLASGLSNARTPYESMPFGVDSVPPEGWRAVFAETSKNGKPIIIGYINKGQLDTLIQGEHRMYSTDEEGALSTSIYLRGDGTMEIGGDVNFMVRYNELETAFNQLKSDFDNHVHGGVIVAVTGGSGSPAVGTPGNSGAPTATTSADIAPAKNENIKIS